MCHEDCFLFFIILGLRRKIMKNETQSAVALVGFTTDRELGRQARTLPRRNI
jgi:hypothetical protein